MTDNAKVTLHLDLNTTEAQRKQDNFITQNQNLKTFLQLDISQAVQEFQNFANQMQNQPVSAKLQLDGTESPEISVKFSTEDAETSFQNFISGIQNQNPVTNLEFDTSQAVQAFSDFISQAQNRTVNARLQLGGTETPQAVTSLKLVTEDARNALQSFLAECQSQPAELNLSLASGQLSDELQNFSTDLHLDTSPAVQSFSDFTNQVQNRELTAKLHLDGADTPQAVTSLHLITDEAKSTLQSFLAECRNQPAELKLTLSSEQIHTELQNLLNQNLTLQLNSDISGARNAVSQLAEYVNSQNFSADLHLDTGQAVQSFQDFVNQAKTTPVNTVLKLENKNQQAVTALKLETEQAKTAFQNFASQVRNQNLTANLRLNLSQARADIQRFANQSVTVRLNYRNQAKASVSLNLDTASANRKLDLFLQRIRSANPVLRLQFDVNSARSRFDSFRNHIRSTRFDARLNLNTSDAQRSLTELLNRISNTNLNLKNSGQSMNNLNGTAQNLGNTLKSLFATGAVIAWGKACISAATGTENAFRGLQSIISGQGRNFSQAQGFIQEYIADGLIPLQNAVTAYKNLASRGYSDTQIQNTLTALKDSAAYGRQSRYSIGEAVASATEGLKNENSILVDNAGVTKNVAKMWQDYAKSIGTTSANLTQAQKIQAEVNGILEETRFQSGDAAKIADSFSGKLSRLTASLTAFKTAVGNILTGALSPLISFLTEGIRKATELTEALGRMLGFTGFEADISGFSAGISSAVTETDSLTESLTDAQKAAETLGSASFDDFNIIGVQESETEEESETESPVISPVLDSSGIQNSISETGNQISEMLNNLFQPFRNAWTEYGQPFLDSMQNAGTQIKTMFSEIGKSFSEVWTNGTGEQAVSSVLEIFRNIYDIIGNIAERFALAWSSGTGTSIVQHLADIFQNVLDTVNHITEKTAEFAGQIDFSPFLNSLDNLLAGLEPLTGHIGEGLEWFFENLLLPVAGFTIENLIPDFLNVLSGAVDILDSSIEALKPFGMWLWEKFIKPLADWTGEIITAGLEGLADVLHNIGDWIRNNPDSAGFIGILTTAFIGLSTAVTGGAFAKMAGNIASFVGKLGGLNVEIAVIAAGIVSWGYVITELKNNWSDICDVFEASGGAFGFIAGWLEYVRDDVEEFFSFGDFGAKWLAFWEGLGEGVYLLTHDIWEGFKKGIQEKFEAVGNFLKEYVFEPFMQSVRALFGIHSPSTVMAEIGGYLVDGLLNAVADGIHRIREIFELMLLQIQAVFENLPAWFGQKFAEAEDAVRQTFRNFGGFFSEKWSAVKEVFSGTESYFSDKFFRAYDKIREAFSGVGGVFSQIWESIKSPFERTADWFRETFSNAWESVKQVFSSGGSVFQGIQTGIESTFRNVVNSLIDGINDVVKTPFQGISEALNTVRGWWLWTPWGDFFPFENLPEIAVPEIPHLAKGGLVRQPTLAMVGDNLNAKNDPEVVSPLSKLKNLIPEQNQNTAILESKLDTLIQLAEIMIDTIADNQPVVQIGDKEIYSASERGRRKFEKMKGVR